MLKNNPDDMRLLYEKGLTSKSLGVCIIAFLLIDRRHYQYSIHFLASVCYHKPKKLGRWLLSHDIFQSFAEMFCATYRNNSVNREVRVIGFESLGVKEKFIFWFQLLISKQIVFCSRIIEKVIQAFIVIIQGTSYILPFQVKTKQPWRI